MTIRIMVDYPYMPYCRRAFALICALLSCSIAASAQFTTPSSGVTKTDDNVGIGIGTATPNAKLWLQSFYGMDYSCTGWTGQTAFKMDWYMPSMFCTPGPSTLPPNALEILGITPSAFGGSPHTSPFLVLGASGHLGIGAFPNEHQMHVSGNSSLDGNLQVGSIGVPGGSRMVVDGDISLKKTGASDWSSIKAHTRQGVLNLAANTGSSDGPSIELCGGDATGRKGEVRIISYGPEASGGGTQFWNFDSATTSWKAHMRILSSGKVYIGEQKPQSPFQNYKLAVDGDFVCRRAVVQTSSWADFVFEPGYALPDLLDVEQYVSEHRHLPGVPSQKTVLENGVDIGDMNKILLQKIEELTLYMIELKKENQELKKAIDHHQK